MDFILKDGYIYLVKNEIPENNKFEGNVVLKYVDDYEHKKFYYSINHGKYHLIKDEIIRFTQDDLKGPYVEITVKAIGKDKTDVFKTDKLPLTRSLILGEKTEDVFPQAINGMNLHIEKVYESLLEKIKLLEKRVKDLEEVGDLI
jgi:hypothetical protein